MRLRRLGPTRVLLAVAVVAAVGYAAARLYVWYEASRGMEALARRIAPVAMLRWQDIDGHLGGGVTAEGVVLTPRGLDDSLRIERFTLRAEGLRGLSEMDERLRAGELPERAALVVEGLSVDVGGAIYRTLVKGAGGALWGTPLDGIACGDAGDVHTRVIEALEYRELIINARLRLRLRREAGRAALFASVGAERLGRSEIDAYLAADSLRLPEDPRAMTAGGGQVALERVRVTYADAGFNDGRNHFCAAEIDTDVATFMDRHLQGVRARLAGAGATPSPELLAAYREFARYGGDIRVDIDPGEPIRPRELAWLTSGETVGALDPTLTINGRRIPLNEAAWVALARPAAAAPAGESAAGADREDGGDATAARRPRLVTVEPGELAAFVDSRTRITTVDDKTYAGRIVDAGEGEVTVRVPMRGGSVTYPLDTARIRHAQVVR